MNPDHSKKLIPLQEAASKLSVSIETLHQWNEHNILKPTFTVSGEIGYTAEQIERFLIIRKKLSEGEIKPKVDSEENEPEVFVDQEDSSQVNFDKPRVFPPLYFLVFSAALLVLGLASYTQQDKLKSMFGARDPNTGKEAVTTKTSTYALSSGAAESPIELNKKSEKSKNLQAESENILQEQNNPINNFYAAVRSAADSLTNKRALTAMPYDKAKQRTEGKADIVAASVAGYTSFASKVAVPATEDHVFDDKGNIKGETKDTLATALGGFGTVTNPESAKASTNLPIQMIVLAIAVLAFVLILPGKHPISLNPAVSPSIPQGQPPGIQEKIIELDQKTDGTIVIVFEGKEFKISKPELYSESDQFFERLMENVNPGIKEIEYDAFGDGRSAYAAPLSRLVTRLGFVGLKRDLFFPRTSKDRVRFRKYLTRKDLDDMRLTTDQILQELSAVS
jgi:DNA-binding transcriptional MerR regulator